MSDHAVNIIQIEAVNPHPGADRLDIVPVQGWQAVTQKGTFKPGDKAIYIEPDYVVPTDQESFAFLKKDGRDKHRLKAVKLRGAVSYGLLIPVPADLEDLPVGTNVMERMAIERYQPPIKGPGGERILPANSLPFCDWPAIQTPKYDMENIQKYPDVLMEGEQVIITEKIHGANARYLFLDGVFYMGSRNRWLKPDDDHIWKQAVDAQPNIEKWCQMHPGVVLYGEIYGRVQSLKYGLPNAVSFAGFAMYEQGRWYPVRIVQESLRECRVESVPPLWAGTWHPELKEIAEENSSVSTAGPGHMMEGIVITPARERYDPCIGRVQLKHISTRYWTGDVE